MNTKWFSSIRQPWGWLSNEQIDALTNLVLHKATRWPDSFLLRWTLVDTLFYGLVTGSLWSKWEKTHEKKKRKGKKGSEKESIQEWRWWNHESIIIQYVTGQMSSGERRLPWSAAEKVYGVAFVNDNHWVLYELDIPRQVITVYDSLTTTLSFSAYEKQFKKLTTLLSSICEEGRVWSDRGYKGKPRSPWWYRRVEHPPQQTNSDDCGIMVIKFLECLVTGRSIASIRPLRCEEFKLRFCAELFASEYICR